MFNSNIPASSLLSIDGSGLCTSTPKTPEILNSLMALTNPLDNYNFIGLNTTNASTPMVAVRNFNGNNVQSLSQDSSHSSSSASPLDSPAGTNTTPSVQQTCSQLIKAGLKLSIQSKRKLSTCDSSSGSEQPNSKCSRRDEDCDETTDDDSETKSVPKGLTPEDEDRRRRRRERNKIAATKCRMKKRERTQNLIKESEQLDTQNIDLKNQVRALETERRKLFEMLQGHAPVCVRRGGCNLPSKLMQSPAMKYLAELELNGSSIGSSNGSANGSGAGTPNSGVANSLASTPVSATSPSSTTTAGSAPQRTTIPPMSSIKFSRSNNFKAVAAVNDVSATVAAVAIAAQQQQQQIMSLPAIPQPQPQSQAQAQQQATLPNGYCKPSPSAQELGYLNSPTQDAICLPNALQATHCNGLGLGVGVGLSVSLSTPPHQQQHQQQATPTNSNVNVNNGGVLGSNNGTVDANSAAAVIVSHSLTDYIPNCDGSLSLAALAHATPSACPTPTSSSGDSSLMLGAGSVPSPLTLASTPTTASEFVKNELVDSQSPYTTAQSAERFLFEHNCDTFVDIKHAVSVHPGIHNTASVASLTAHANNNNNLLDFQTPLLGSVPFHDGMKNYYMHDADLLEHLTGDPAEFVDLDTGAAAFLPNGDCMA